MQGIVFIDNNFKSITNIINETFQVVSFGFFMLLFGFFIFKTVFSTGKKSNNQYPQSKYKINNGVYTFVHEIFEILLLIYFVQIIFSLFLSNTIDPKKYLIYFFTLIINYMSLVFVLLINANNKILQFILHQIIFGIIIILFTYCFNFQFKENSKDINFSIVVDLIKASLLIWLITYKSNLNTAIRINEEELIQNFKELDSLQSFILNVKNCLLISEKTIKDSEIVVNGYKRILKH